MSIGGPKPLVLREQRGRNNLLVNLTTNVHKQATQARMTHQDITERLTENLFINSIKKAQRKRNIERFAESQRLVNLP